MSFSINLTKTEGKTNVRIAMTLAPDDNVTSAASIASVVVNDPAELAIDVSRDGDAVAVVVTAASESIEATLRMLELHHAGEPEKTLYVRRLTNQLNDEFTFALMDALKDQPVQSAPVAVAPLPRASVTKQPGEAVAAEVVASKPLSRKSRVATGVVVVLAAGLVVYGTFLHKHKAEAASDPSAQLTSALPSNVAAQIDAVVHPTSGVPSNFSSTNVALSTMRAMGLNPGKAGTSCLVGLR